MVFRIYITNEKDAYGFKEGGEKWLKYIQQDNQDTDIIRLSVEAFKYIHTVLSWLSNKREKKIYSSNHKYGYG